MQCTCYCIAYFVRFKSVGNQNVKRWQWITADARSSRNVDDDSYEMDYHPCLIGCHKRINTTLG